MSCGQTLTANTTFSNNLVGCTGTGVYIGANNIVVNLNGHTISGTGNNDGVDFNGYTGVTLMNGRVQYFYNAVYVDSNNNRINSITTRNSYRGVDLYGANGTKINSGNEGANDYGLYVDYATNSVITGVTANNNRYPIRLLNGSFNTLTRSIASSNDDNNAIGVSYESNDLLSYNTANNSDNGFYFYSPNGPITVTRNTASGNTDGFYSENNSSSSPITFSLNQAYRNSCDGFDDRNTGDSYNGDKAQFNGCQGFYLSNVSGVLLKNVIAGSSSNVPSGGGGNGGGSCCGGYGIYVSSGDSITILNSKANNNAPTDGIFLDSSVTNTLLNGNTTNGNGYDGVETQSSAVTISNSVAAFNVNYGFDAPFATDGGGNHAHDNGAGQCTANFTSC